MEALNNFCIDGNFVSIEPYGEGHINQTFAATFEKNGGRFRVLVQRINNNIFTDVPSLMRNISLVCSHVRQKVLSEGGNVDRECLQIIPTRQGESFYKNADGYWRAYVFIENATSHQRVDNPQHFYQSACAFGRFQRYLQDFDASLLSEPLKDFHNTVVRYNNFQQAVEADLHNRARLVAREVQFVRSRRHYASRIVDLLGKDIPLKVTHNDTKLNNVMIDNDSGRGIAVIDLDTVMAGSALYDFGDSIRFGCNNALEDEEDLSKVTFNLDLYKLYLDGYLSELGGTFTPAEMDNLGFSAILMTFECGMRFLTDHLNGDVYFRIKKPNHNLIRARNQFKLVEEMERVLI